MKIIGLLGNHMFKYAATYCFAKRFNSKLVYNSTLLWALFPYLSAQKELPDEYDDKERHSRQGGGSFGDCRRENIDDFISTGSRPDLLIAGYLQTWCYFQDCEKEVRQEFRFHPSLVAARDEFLFTQAKAHFGNTVQPSKVTYIGVHIRRGNFVKLGWPVAPPSYFDKAVSYMENVTRDSKHKMYVVASNDLPWAQANFTAQSPIVFADQNTPQFSKANFDFAILAGCNHTIMSVGTYSWWAAYMAGGAAVYYRVGPGVNVTAESKDAHYLPRWKGLE